MGMLGWVKKRWGDSAARLPAAPKVSDPVFEQLEPRLLLSADVTPLQDVYALESFEEQVIEVVVSSQLSVLSEA